MLRRQSSAANRATSLIGPRVASVLNVRGRWPDGGAFGLRVLLLGERHSPAPEWLDPPPGQMTATQLFQAATYRGLARGRCVDFFIEHGIQRSVVTDQGSRSVPIAQPDTARSSTLQRVRYELDPCVPHASQIRQPTAKRACRLGENGRRVHYFDTRTEMFWDVSQANGDAIDCWRRTSDASDDVPEWMSADLQKWMWFFMGLDPQGGFSAREWPPSTLAPFQAAYLEDNPDYMRAFLRVQAAARERVRRRARRLGVERARWLAEHVAATADAPDSLTVLMANASDLYLMLRMTSPYVARPGSPCASGVPRCCVVYAGVVHTRHVQRTVGSMLGHVWSMPTARTMPRAAKQVAAQDVESNDQFVPGFFTNWGKVLEAIGLPDPDLHKQDNDDGDREHVWRHIRLTELDAERLRVSYDHDLVRVAIIVEGDARTFRPGTYQIAQPFACPVRLAAFYSGDPEDRSAPRAPPGTARAVLCSVLRFMVAHGLTRPDECIVLEADPSLGGGLRRFYERIGFEIVGVERLQTQDGDRRPAIDRGALMRAPVARVIDMCERG